MNIWKYYAITHHKHDICNPMYGYKLDKLLKLLDLKPGSRVLDIGCGKGEVLIRLAEMYGISGIGIDASPYFIKDCRQKKEARVPSADIEFLEMEGASYSNEANELFGLTACIGASFAYGGLENTITALKKMTRPKGLILIGEPYWLQEPDPQYLKQSGLGKEDISTHLGNIESAQKQGLACIYTMVSNKDDWDHYETLQWWSTIDYMESNPDDKDNAELTEKLSKTKYEYLSYGRDTVNWAIYVFKRQ